MYLKYIYSKLILYLHQAEEKNMEKDKHLGLRIDAETHKKLKNLADYDGRSINGEVMYLIRQAIMKHEDKHGILK